MKKEPYIQDNPQSTSIHHDINDHRYITNMCRNGPLPESRHAMTDITCLILFPILLLILCGAFLINLISSLESRDQLRQYKPEQLPLIQTVAYLLEHNILNITVTTFLLMGIGLLLLIVGVLLPAVAGIIIIGLSFLLLFGMLYLQLFAHWGRVYTKVDQYKLFTWDDRQVSVDWFRITLIVVTACGIFLLIALICFRLKKLKNLKPLMKINSFIIKKNLPLLPLTMVVVLSTMNLAVWIIMSLIFWENIQMKYEAQRHLPIPLVFVWILFFICWIWIHGIQVSVADYICQSWVIHWYYQQIKEKENEGTKKGWRLDIFRKMFRYHLGTIFIGFFLAYLPEGIIHALKKGIIKGNKKSMQKPKGVFGFITILNRYFYVETVMECLNLKTATDELFYLRKRIKNKIPEIYMVGHFLEDILKLFLVMLGIFINFYLNFMQQELVSPFKGQITNLQLLGFLIVTACGICFQIANNISHLFGMVNDTAVITYSIDSEIQRVYYGSNHPRSVPEGLDRLFLGLLNKNISYSENESVTKKSKFEGYQYFNMNMNQRKSVLDRYSGLEDRTLKGKDAFEYRSSIRNPYIYDA